MLHGPRKKSEFTMLFEKIIEGILINFHRFTFYYEQNENCIRFDYKISDDKIINLNMTEILQKTDLSHIFLNNAALALAMEKERQGYNYTKPVSEENAFVKEMKVPYQPMELSLFEKFAIGRYVADSNLFNYFLREQYLEKKMFQDDNPDTSIKRLLIKIAGVSSGLNKLPPSGDKVLYRGERRFSLWAHRETALNTNHVAIEKYSSFLSTSYEKGNAVTSGEGQIEFSDLSGKDLTTALKGSYLRNAEKEVLALPCEIKWEKLEKNQNGFSFFGREIRPLYPEIDQLNNDLFQKNPDYKELYNSLNESSEHLNSLWSFYELQEVDRIYNLINQHFDRKILATYSSGLLGQILIKTIRDENEKLIVELLKIKNINVLVLQENKSAIDWLESVNLKKKDLFLEKINQKISDHYRELRLNRNTHTKIIDSFYKQFNIDNSETDLSTADPELLGQVLLRAIVYCNEKIINKVLDLNCPINIHAVNPRFNNKTARELIREMGYENQETLLEKIDLKEVVFK